MIRDIIKKIFSEYDVESIDKNKLAINDKETYFELTDTELAILEKEQKDKTLEKELEPILKKILTLFYVGRIGKNCYYMYVLTKQYRRPNMTALRSIGFMTEKCISLTKKEGEYILKLLKSITFV